VMANKQLKSMYTSFILLFVILSFGSAGAQDSTSFNPTDAQYLWPTNASNALSSTFAETRSGHFHAALDIKTWGRRGYPIYATRSGTLYRMAVGPTGYGKVLYLQHDDGSFSVYAHLLRFNEELQQLADSIRFSDYSPSFDMWLDTMNIEIEQGEEIALSGASGIGPPHLHFELRTPDEEPFNPLLTNLNVKDTIGPSFSGIAVEPLSIRTKIEGNNKIITRRPRRQSAYAHFGIIETTGPIGLGVDVFDQANGVPNAYAVYELRLKVDGKERFYSRVDQFSYQETDQMYLDRIYTLLQSTGRSFQRLYVTDGNTLSFYQTPDGGGRLNLDPGRHNIEIEATDFNGNTRTARLTLSVVPPKAEPGLLEEPFTAHKSPDIQPKEWSWFNNWVNIPRRDFPHITLAPLLATPTAGPLVLQNDETLSVDQKASPQYFFRTSPINIFIPRRVYPQKMAYLLTPNEQAYATFNKATFYDTASVAITRKNHAADSVEINIFPTNIPLRTAYELSVRVDSAQRADSTLSFYKTYPGSRYLRKLTTYKDGAFIKTSPSSMGRFLLLSDTTPPRLGTPSIVKSPDEKWLVYIPATDNRSGVGYQNTRIYVNGRRGLTEYEPEDDRLVYYHPNFIPQKNNKVKVITFDMEGNKTSKEMTIAN